MALWIHHGHADHLVPCADGSPDGHRPDIAGERCELCGLRADPRPVRGSAAERLDRERLARELSAAVQDAQLRAEGQVPWLA